VAAGSGRIQRLVEHLLESAEEAVVDRRWYDVVSLANDVLDLAPGNDEATRLAKLGERKAHGLPHELRVQPQLRQLTVLMCDQQDSSGFSERHDPETVHEISVHFHEAVSWTVERHGGRVEHHQGDGVLAYFGYPRGQQDAARRAVQAGIDLLAEVDRLDRRVAHDLADQLVVRVAVHTDMALVADFEEAAISRPAALSGPIANLASRLQQLADGHSVIITDATRALIEGQFVMDRIGEVQLRGFSQPVVAHRVLAPLEARSRLEAAAALSPFAGRSYELATLLEHWQAVRGGTRMASAVTGEPGIGKSRLVHEIEQQIRADGGQVLHAACRRESRAEQWHPIRWLLAGLAGFGHDDDNDTRWAKLRTALTPHVPDPDRDLPLLALVAGVVATGQIDLPDVHPVLLRELTLTTVSDVLCHLSSSSPTVLTVEDLQWADPSTLELLTRLTAATEALPLWLLMTTRQEPPADLACEVVELQPLEEASASRLAAELTGMPEASLLVAGIVTRSSGVPLYIEELARSITPEQRESDVVPTTLRDLLQERLDAAGPRARRIAQVMATVGQEVQLRLLEAVLGRAGINVRSVENEIDLVRLLRAGIIERVDAQAEPTLRFHHVLLQETSYAGQLAVERLERHAAVADVLAQQGPAAENPHAAVIARHLALADRSEDALHFYLAAVQQASSQAAYKEVVQHVDAALAILDAAPEEVRAGGELALRMWRAHANTYLAGYAAPLVLADYERALELCWSLRQRERGGRDVGLALIGLWASLAVRGDLRRTADVLEATIGLEEDAEAADLACILTCCRGMDELFRGRVPAALAHLADALTQYDDEAPTVEGWKLPNCPMVATLATYGLGLIFQGDLTAAQQAADRALARAAFLPFPVGPYSTAFAKAYRALALRNTGELEQARLEALEVVAIGERHGFADWIGNGGIHLAAIEAATGDPVAAETLVSAVDAWQAMGGGLFLASFLAEASEAMLVNGQVERAASLLDRAFGLVEQTGQDSHLVEMIRVRAAVRRAQGAPAEEVEGLVFSGLRLAEEQGNALFAAKLRDQFSASTV
jgi:class 3 adenylate cyclase